MSPLTGKKKYFVGKCFEPCRYLNLYQTLSSSCLYICISVLTHCYLFYLMGCVPCYNLIVYCCSCNKLLQICFLKNSTNLSSYNFIIWQSNTVLIGQNQGLKSKTSKAKIGLHSFLEALGENPFSYLVQLFLSDYPHSLDYDPPSSIKACNSRLSTSCSLSF